MHILGHIQATGMTLIPRGYFGKKISRAVFRTGSGAVL